ncbi:MULTISPECIES: acetoacetate decarboxylase family protein [Mycobacteriaceae]|uniref:Acetoacetate decarboxylase n=1 Tax=Mycolicibacterium novocastrense TaxID=59813 RepID=A0AAW5SKM0_MYCNV|nr:acetoacetate decarboxylase family protein [Mycolicibacterium novocastrense]MCV7024623.1 acetoacetate decarboxylase family protein [Mycolicibacterium novocastrense]GAT11376.1 acetoacetate decarboxylase [Mycolicibacterium novocastrense]
MTQHTIAGTVLTMPVKIRKAHQHMAMFSVDAEAAQRMIDYSGLKVCRFLPGRAIAVLMLMRYEDGDLGQYYEYGTNVMVNPPGSDATGPRALQSAGAFIHHLPVDQAFTLEAGTKIWGYPKVMSEFTIRDGHTYSFDVTIDGQFAVGMDFRRGLRVPATFTAKPQAHPTYSCRDGVVRRTVGEMKLSDVRYRPGGARVRLGEHPYAKELASLGFPKRALFSGSAGNVEMSFADAEELGS